MPKRKKTKLELIRRIVAEIWHHPSNRQGRLRAVARAGAWQVTKRARKGVRTRTVFGDMKIRMEPRSGSASNLIYFGDLFDTDEMTFMQRYLRPGDAVIDVGANIGAYTLYAAHLVGPTGRVEAFEAVPWLGAELEQNIALNDLGSYVIAHRVAVSDRPGTVRFRTDLDVSSRMAVASDSEAVTAEVPAEALDSSLPPDVDWTLAKIDVEGAELAAVKGFREHLGQARPPVLLMELLPGQLRKQGTSPEEVVGTLAELGYELGYYRAEDHTLVSLADQQLPKGNVLVIHGDRWDFVRGRLGQRDDARTTSPS